MQGESSWAGFPCAFVRLTGCPLRCRWCDTVYGFKGGQSLSFQEVLDQLAALDVNLVELTGGEPLAQEHCYDFMQVLVSKNYKVLIETSGSHCLKRVPEQVHIIMDIKCPGSGMESHNNFENLNYLKASDEIKFVVASREDFDWAIDLASRNDLFNRFNILFSPAWGLVDPQNLVDWLLERPIKARLNLQQHKYIWSPRKRGI